jgi:hypothetical protein
MRTSAVPTRCHGGFSVCALVCALIASLQGSRARAFDRKPPVPVLAPGSVGVAEFRSRAFVFGPASQDRVTQDDVVVAFPDVRVITPETRDPWNGLLRVKHAVLNREHGASDGMFMVADGRLNPKQRRWSRPAGDATPFAQFDGEVQAPPDLLLFDEHGVIARVPVPKLSLVRGWLDQPLVAVGTLDGNKLQSLTHEAGKQKTGAGSFVVALAALVDSGQGLDSVPSFPSSPGPSKPSRRYVRADGSPVALLFEDAQTGTVTLVTAAGRFQPDSISSW